MVTHRRSNGPSLPTLAFCAAVSFLIATLVADPVLPGPARAGEPAPRGETVAGTAAERLAPADPGYLTPRGSIGGPTRAVFGREGLAYVCVGARLVIADVRDPAHPRRLGSVTLPDDALSVFVDGNYAFVSSFRHGGVRIIDVSDPSSPREVAAYPGGAGSAGGWAEELVVRDGLAYLVWSTGVSTVFTCGLRILDVTNPTSPRLLADYMLPDAWWPGSGLAIAGNLAFIAAGYQGLRIVDISDPTAPRQVGFVPARGYVGDVVVAGRYAFIVEDGVPSRVYSNTGPAAHGIRVLDVTRPEQPRDAAFLPTEGAVRDMVALADTLVLTEHAPSDVHWDTDGGVRIVSVRDPVRPRSVAHYPFPTRSGIGDGVLFATPGGRLLVTGTGVVDRGEGTSPRQENVYNGLWILDASRPDEALPVVGQLTDAGFDAVADLATHRELVYAAAGDDGVRVIAPTSPGGPLDIGGVAISGPAESIAVRDANAFATSTRGAVHVLDLAVPVAPVVTGYLGPRDAGGASDVVASDSRLYVGIRGEWGECPDGPCHTGGGLRVVDPSDPYAPRETAWLPLEHVTGVALADGVLLAADGRRLWVFDLTAGVDPPPLLGVWVCNLTVPEGSQTMDIVAIAGEGSFAYAAVGHESAPFAFFGGLVVLALDVPDLPRQIAFSRFADGYSGIVPQALAVSQGTAFVAQRLARYKYYSWPRRLDAVDVSDPSAPVVLDALYGSTAFSSLAVDGDRVVAAGTDVHFFHSGSVARGLVVDGVGRPVVGARVRLGSRETASAEGGEFGFRALRSGSHVLIGADPRLVFQPARHAVTVPPDRDAVRFVVHPAPVSATLPGPAASLTLAYTDTQGLPTWLVFPPGVVTATATVTITPVTPRSFRDGERYGAHAFTLSVADDGRPAAHPTLARAAAVSIRYSDSDAWALAAEAELELYRLDGTSWTVARAGCGDGAETTVHASANLLETVLCRGGTYALFGPTRQSFLPLATAR